LSFWLPAIYLLASQENRKQFEARARPLDMEPRWHHSLLLGADQVIEISAVRSR
jgi:hypothetical protein